MPVFAEKRSLLFTFFCLRGISCEFKSVLEEMIDTRQLVVQLIRSLVAYVTLGDCISPFFYISFCLQVFSI